MDDYDDLFADTAPEDSVFAEKAALDPLREPETVVAREAQERELARLLQGVHEGYLPATVSIYGPPGAGKTLTTRRVCEAFADRTDALAVEYVNLKECRSLFSAANEIHRALTGERRGAYAGLDGVFEGIWDALADYPAWTVLLLDEIDHVQHDANYAPSEFFYRLLRGEGRLAREIDLSAWLISNELLEVDLRLDSRVRSAMSDEEVFFPPYGRDKLAAVVTPQLERAFRDGALPEEVRRYGVREAARRWGDARKALTLFRQAGETATADGRATVTEADIDANLDATEQEAVTEKLLGLPENHFVVLLGVTGRENRRTGEIVQPVTTQEIVDLITGEEGLSAWAISARAVREIVTDLETMGLVETWIESRGNEGRQKQVRTTFEPQWVHECVHEYVEHSDMLDAE